LLGAAETARDHYLNTQLQLDEAAKRDEAQKARDAEVERQNQIAFQRGIEQAKTEYVSQTFQKDYESAFNSIAEEWQPTSDPNLNFFQHENLMNTLVNLTDERMDFRNVPLLERLGYQNAPQLLAEIREAVSAWEGAVKDLKLAEAHKSKLHLDAAAKEAQRAHDRWLGKVNGVRAKMVEAQSAANTAAREGKESVFTQASAARPGLSAVVTPNQVKGLPAGVRPGTPEYDEYQVARWG
jgi:hypothetical protein